MGLYCILRILLWAAAVLEARAVVQNVTLAAGASDNITFNGPGWQGPGGWQGPTPENAACNTSIAGQYSWGQGASVSVVFQGIAVYFVGWNNSRNGLYQSYIDGVPDSVVTAYIPASESWVCNVFQYEKMGLANTNHNLTLALLPNDPGDIGTPGLSVNGFIITTDDSPAPLPSTSGSPVPPTTPSSSAASTSFSDPSVVPSTLSDSSPIPSTKSSDSLIFSTSSDTSPVSTTVTSGSTTAVSSTVTRASTALSTSSEASLVSSTFTTGSTIAVLSTTTAESPAPSATSDASSFSTAITTLNAGSTATVTVSSSTTSLFNTPNGANRVISRTSSTVSTAFISVSTTTVLSTMTSDSPAASATGDASPVSTTFTTVSTTTVLSTMTSDSPALSATSDASPVSTTFTTSAGSTAPVATSTTGLFNTPGNNNGVVSRISSDASPVSTTFTTNAGLTAPISSSTTSLFNTPGNENQVVSRTSSDASPVSTTFPINAGSSATVSSSTTSLFNMPSDDNGVLTPSNNVSPGLPATTSSSPILSTPSTSSRSAVPPTGDSSPMSRTTGDASLVSPTNNIAPTPSPVLLTASDSSLVSRTATDASLFSTTNTVAAKPGPVSTPSTNDNPGLPTPNHDHLISSTAAEASSLPPTIAVAPAPNFIPSTSSDNTPVSGSTAQSFASAKSPSHRTKITHSIIAGIVGLVGIVCVAALANLAYQISIAKKAGKPGSFPNKSHKFIFVIPPYMPDLRRNKRPNSYQITLTLTPVDIQDDYTYQQVAWQRFNINDGSDQFTATLQYDRAFGAANIRNSVDSINRVSWCDPPVSFGHAKPGRPVYLRQSTWKALNFIRWKYQRIIARNEDRVPVRMVIGSYICHEEGGGEPTEISQHVADENVEEAIEIDALVPKPNEDAGFQSFVVLDETIDYAEQISASFDLILRAYKTQDVEVGQILPWNYLRDKAVPLLGEQGIRLSKLPKVATWSILSDGSDMELIMERPALRSRILDNVHRLSPF